MKIKVEFDLEIDGELDEEKAKDVFAEMFLPCDWVFLSEDYEDAVGKDTKEWALCIAGWRVC